ncbi:MAG: transcription termination factor Rho [Planctomycetota bacterium]
MRYFSTEDLDFGDEGPAEGSTRPRSERSRYSSEDSYRPEGGDAPSPGDRDPRSSFRGRGRRRFGRGPDNRDPRSFDRDLSTDPESGSAYSSDSEDLSDFDAAGDLGDDREPSDSDTDRGEPGTGGPRFSEGDRRPRRRRRRRRGGPDQGSQPDGRNDTTRFSRDSGRRDSRDNRDSGRGGRFDNSRNDARSGGGRGRGGRRPEPSRGRDSGRRRDPIPRRGRNVAPSTEVVEGTFDGVLELHDRGYGFLRDPKKNYAAEDSNPFVSSSLVEKYKLREGVLIRGQVGQGTRNQGPRLHEVELIDGFTPEEYLSVKHFDTLTPINPFEQIKLEIGPRPLTMRVMDLLCPIGKGQRALLVAPPRTGKTMLLQDIANSVSINHPEIHLMVLLIDERPEEVTEMRRMVKGEVISSTLDSDMENHIRLAELIIERAKRLAEEGKDVFILLDSITRLARAFNKANNSGRTGTGGLDIRAMDIPKKLFGQARRFDEGGSLTVCGTALIDTGGRIDEAIFQEFKGTGNMEMVLSRELADRRIWPSIDITKSGTRREEKILPPDMLEGITMLRRSLISLSPVEAMEQLTRTMEKFPTNREFLSKIKAVL